MNIISIDPSLSSTGVYIKLDKEGISRSIVTTKLKTESEKYNYIYDELKKLILEYDIKVCFIEDYAFNYKNSRSITRLAEVKGIITFLMYRYNIDVLKVPIMTWKSLAHFIPADNKASKGYTKKINKYYKKEFQTSDECDAYLILVAMYYIYKGVCKVDSHLILQRKLKAMGELF